MNLLKDKWFIRVTNEAQAIAIQEYMFDKDLTWTGRKEMRYDFSDWDKANDNTWAIGSGHHSGGNLGQARPSYWLRNGHKELIINTKLVVDIVKPLELESSQQIKKIEENIVLLTAQLNKLKEELK